MTKCYDVLGYVLDGYCLCTNHIEYIDTSELSPIFASEETDTDILCDACYSKAFEQDGLTGEQLRDACLIIGKNIWYPDEIKELAICFLDTKILDTPLHSDIAHCLNYSVIILRGSETLEKFYNDMEGVIAQLDALSTAMLSLETVEHYQDMYTEIIEDVKEHIRSKTES